MPTRLERMRVDSLENRQDLARVAIQDLGGPTKACKILNKYHPLTLSPEAIIAWRNKGVPVHYVALVARLTGIEASQLCPWGWWG